MPIHRPDHAIRIALKILALVAITIPLLSLTPADATEKAAPPTSKHKSIVKKNHLKVSKVPRLKIAKAHPYKTARKNDLARRSAAKFSLARLTLAKNIDSATQKSTARSAPTSVPVNLPGSRLAPEETDPPLQIGKTLYQRNGEIRQVEAQ